ncbi:MAG: hypothetical protein WC043_03650 [Pseudobdellovibrionaceae bacterium]
MAKRLKRDPARQFLYEIAVNNWQIDASFNDFAYINIFDREQFEETIRLEMTGVISYCSTKKLKKGQQKVKVLLFPSDHWYHRNQIVEGAEVIGEIKLTKLPEDEHTKDRTLLVKVSLPIKSYENIRSYLSYKGTGVVEVVGQEINRGEADIYYFKFRGKGLMGQIEED